MRLNPDLYHGEGKENGFFEGWYFRMITPSGRSLALIPGISKGDHPHAFVQVVDHEKKEGAYLSYPAESFWADPERLAVTVGENRFSLSRLSLCLEGDHTSIHGELRLTNIAKWPDSALCPGSMGFFNHLSFLECYNQVCALDGRASGKLVIDGEPVAFGGSSLYVEKNWGCSFPAAWFWAQSNRFEDGRAAFTCSIGRVPIGGFQFDGMLMGLLLDGTFHRFTTMNGSEFRLKRFEGGAVLKAANLTHLLTLRVKDDGHFLRLAAPDGFGMGGRAPESLASQAVLTLTKLSTGDVIYCGKTRRLGLEYGGEWEK